jgi:tetratricopeptide (TPR) repeat protein
MPTERTDKYWARMKFAIWTLVIGFIIVVLAFAVVSPDVEGPNADNTPLLDAIIFAWFFSILFSVILFWHSLYRDKQELSKDFPDINQRHWITIGILSYFTAGIYPLWYLFARYKRTRNDIAKRRGTLDAFSSTASLATNLFNSDQTTSISKKNPSQKDDTRSSTNSDTTKATDTGLLSTIRGELDNADSLRESAEEARDNGRYERALKKYNEAKEVYNSALETAKDSDFDDVINLRDIKQNRNGIETAQEETYNQQFKNEIKEIQSKFDQAENLIENGELKKAQNRLRSFESHLLTVKESAEQRGFDEIYDKATGLENRRKEYLTEITRQLCANTVPKEIPHAPNLSVDYDSLINEEQIGSGGNSIVNKMTLSTSDGNMKLAVKEPRISGTLHTEQVNRILQEAETWNKLDDHDHIVGVIDYDREPIPWIAMEYMDGGHLGEQTGEIETAQALWTAIAVTKGVRHAHRRGIAHLDLKPQNILFRTIEDMWDVPKVADWGLSKHLLDHSKSIDGYTPAYSAPEQLDEGYGKADDITDVYQLGAVFYELFTGIPPFDAETTGKVIRQILDEDPTPPSEIADVPDELDTVLLTALSKNKKDRYEDILLLRNALQSVFEEHTSVDINQIDQEIGYVTE